MASKKLKGKALKLAVAKKLCEPIGNKELHTSLIGWSKSIAAVAIGSLVLASFHKAMDESKKTQKHKGYPQSSERIYHNPRK